MLYFLVVLYLVLYYVRPAEWVPGLIGFPLMLVAGVVAISYLAIGTVARLLPHIVSGQVERMMYGYVLAIGLSRLGGMYLGGMSQALEGFLPTLAGFLLVICFVDSKKRLNTVVLLLIVLTGFLAYQGYLQHATGSSAGGLEPLFDKIYAEGGTVLIPRIRWHGVLNDPNDLGLALVLVVPFLLDMLLKRRLFWPVLTLPLITLAIYYTNSRGTVLAGLTAIGSYFIIRYRSIRGAFIGVALAVALFLLGPSRMSTVSASEESAYGRIEAWYEAYQMFKTNPLFGVGQGLFTEFHHLTAHNSFVLVMAELGFVGLFFFTGFFYYPYQWLWNNMMANRNSLMTPADVGLVSAAYASLTGMLAAMFFISRSYMLLPFMQVALVTGLTRVFDQELGAGDASEEKPRHLRNIALLTVMQIVGINLIVKLFI